MAILRTTSIVGVLCAALLAACSGNSNNVAATSGSGGGATGGAGAGGGTGGGAGTGGGGFMTAAHAAPPQVVNPGGPVLKTPKVQPIAYSDDADLGQINMFLQELAKTTYWGEVTSEYGVGAITVLPTIMQTGTAPASLSDDEMNAALAANLTGANPLWGAADPNTIYLFLAPTQTKVADPNTTDPNVSYGCTDYDGYHGQASITAGVSVAYAVGCSCPGFDGKGVTNVQERTVAISHELVEAATDPFPNNNPPGFSLEDNADIVWTWVTGGELADMCEFNLDSYVVPPGSTYMIQRSWSNKAAKAGTNPCVPVVKTAPYFNSAPVLPDMLKVYGFGPAITTPGVKIAVGASKTIPITLFSEAPTSGPFKVTVYDGNTFQGGSAYLKFSLDKNTGVNGDTLQLTITVMSGDPTYKVEPFVIFADLNGQENISMGFVGQ